jgi:hypothetical protein
VPLYFSAFEFPAVHRQDNGDPARVHTYHRCVDQKKFVAIRHEQVFETIHLEHLIDTGGIDPAAFQLLTGTRERPCTEGYGVVVSRMPEADENGLILKVQVIELVDEVWSVDGLVMHRNVILNAILEDMGGVGRIIHCPPHS